MTTIYSHPDGAPVVAHTSTTVQPATPVYHSTIQPATPVITHTSSPVPKSGSSIGVWIAIMLVILAFVIVGIVLLVIYLRHNRQPAACSADQVIDPVTNTCVTAIGCVTNADCAGIPNSFCGPQQPTVIGSLVNFENYCSFHACTSSANCPAGNNLTCTNHYCIPN